MRSREHQVRAVMRDYKESRLNGDGRRLVALFKEDGTWSGDVMNGGYSASDRQRNGDLTYAELSPAVQAEVDKVLEEACSRLTKMRLPFGRGLLFSFPVVPTDIVGSAYHV